MKERNLAFIDLETTGLELKRHEIIEIGCIVARQIQREPGEKGGASLQVIEEFEIKVKPEHFETADPVSLEINGYREDDWKDALSLSAAMQIVAEKTKEANIVAHNVAFDWMFLEKAFEETGVKNMMHYHKLDTIPIAFAKLYDVPEVQKFSLRSLCEYYGIENKKAHTALSDARATYELYRRLMNA
ncbi:MAG: 3'-5' exonuclease [Patescibacteria group bacterium]